MPQTLRFPDSEARDDFLTFASRASRLSDPEVRLEASAGTLAMWAPILVPRGLLDRTPTILALRALPIDPELVCDLVVSAGSVGADGASPDGGPSNLGGHIGAPQRVDTRARDRQLGYRGSGARGHGASGRGRAL